MKLLIVDDALLNRRHYEMMMRDIEECDIISFETAEEALRWCEDGGKPDFIVSDYVLPGMNGVDFLRRVHDIESLRSIPVLMISASDDKAVRRAAFAAGALDFVEQPVDHHEFPQRIRNLLAIRRQMLEETATADWLAAQVRHAVAQLLQRESEVIQRLARIAEYRDPETGLHAARVGHYAKLLAARLGLPLNEVESIYLTAPLHDVGKVSVPDYILTKSGKLTSAEFAIMQQHTVVGYELLRDDTSPLLNTAATIALSHHERYDGSGYPHKRKAEDIPLVGRICAVADTFDVLTSVRPYKPAWTIEDAAAEIRRCSGSHFDPSIVSAFDAVLRDIAQIRRSMIEPIEGSAPEPYTIMDRRTG